MCFYFYLFLNFYADHSQSDSDHYFFFFFYALWHCIVFHFKLIKPYFIESGTHKFRLKVKGQRERAVNINDTEAIDLDHSASESFIRCSLCDGLGVVQPLSSMNNENKCFISVAYILVFTAIMVQVLMFLYLVDYAQHEECSDSQPSLPLGCGFICDTKCL